MRIINHISGPSKGESIGLRDALPPCLPMAMPASAAVRYVGYLNHPVEDRWMPQSPLDVNVHFHGFQGARRSGKHCFCRRSARRCTRSEYHLVVPRSQPPGTYFYHPHVQSARRAIRSPRAAWRVRGSSSRTLRRLRRGCRAHRCPALPLAVRLRQACLHRTSRRSTAAAAAHQPH